MPFPCSVFVWPNHENILMREKAVQASFIVTDKTKLHPCVFDRMELFGLQKSNDFKALHEYCECVVQYSVPFSLQGA